MQRLTSLQCKVSNVLLFFPSIVWVSAPSLGSVHYDFGIRRYTAAHRICLLLFTLLSLREFRREAAAMQHTPQKRKRSEQTSAAGPSRIDVCPFPNHYYERRGWGAGACICVLGGNAVSFQTYECF